MFSFTLIPVGKFYFFISFFRIKPFELSTLSAYTPTGNDSVPATVLLNTKEGVASCVFVKLFIFFANVVIKSNNLLFVYYINRT